MSYANNHGVRIHYELEGKGPPLVLMHGLTEDLGWWHDSGYVESLRNSYRLILIDARGHGASDKPHNPDAYKLELLISDIVQVLNNLKIPKAHYFGFSMGAWIGYGIGKHAPERFHSLILSSMNPYKDPNAPNNLLDLFKKGKDTVWAEIDKIMGQWKTPQLQARLSANDLEALIALVSKDWMFNFEAIIPTITLPCLLIAGETDPNYSGVKKCAANMPNAIFISFPNLGHIDTLFRSDLVIPHIKKFLAKIP